MLSCYLRQALSFRSASFSQSWASWPLSTPTLWESASALLSLRWWSKRTRQLMRAAATNSVKMTVSDTKIRRVEASSGQKTCRESSLAPSFGDMWVENNLMSSKAHKYLKQAQCRLKSRQLDEHTSASQASILVKFNGDGLQMCAFRYVGTETSLCAWNSCRRDYLRKTRWHWSKNCISQVITHIPGGILSEKFGGKYTLGLGILSTAIFTLITPVVINWGEQTTIDFQRLSSRHFW